MSELFGKRKDKINILKELIRRLHKGENLENLKEEFKKILENLSPVDISGAEEELIKEGVPREEIHKLCDVHLAALKDVLDSEKVLAPAGHPIYTLMEEHRIILDFADKLKNNVKDIRRKKLDSILQSKEELNNIVKYLKDSESHYLREENVLFPYLEKHGVTQPPVIMWMEHERIRQEEKDIYKVMDMYEKMDLGDFTEVLEEKVLSLYQILSTHFYKENKILFPTALKVVEKKEWKEIREGFDELGYCCFTPEPAKTPDREEKVQTYERIPEGRIPLEVGSLSREEIEIIFNTLPVDITFVDKEDKVRYFSKTKDRIFPRTKAIIGRKVQQCHPQKSVDIVNKILDDFKKGHRNIAEFWINLKEKIIYIRYFALHNKKGDYIGCIEVTQDITDIKKLEGERRIYDER